MTVFKPVEWQRPVETHQPWGIETLLAVGPGYTLKVLKYRAGEGGGLQYHMAKSESFAVLEGCGVVRYDRGDGTLVEVRLGDGSSEHSGDTVHIPAGTPHQFTAITDCLVVEASTPGTNDRVNVAERYGRTVPEGTLPTTYTAEEIAAFERTLQ